MATRKRARKTTEQPQRPAGPYRVQIAELVEHAGYDFYLERGLTVLYAIECDLRGVDCNYSLCETYAEAADDVDELNRRWAAAQAAE